MKVLLPLRVFLVFGLLGLISFPSHAFFQNSPSKVVTKTKYEFTDTRISEADTLLKSRKYEEALSAYQRAYDTYESEDFYEGMVYAKERMGRSYRGLGEDSLSRVSYELATKLSRNKLGPNHILESKAYLNNGIRAHFKNSFVKAAGYFDTAMVSYDDSYFYDSLLYKNLIDFKFYSYYYSDVDRDTLIKYLNLRAEYFDFSGSGVNDNIYLLSDYSRTFYRRGEFFKSVAYGLEATRIANQDLGSVGAFFYSDALFNLVRSLNMQRDYPRALIMGNRLVDFTLEKDPDSRSLMGYFNVKAITLNGLERYEEAAIEFQKILRNLEKRNEFGSFYRTSTMNLGVCYELMGEYDLAKEFLFKALNEEKEVANGLVPSLSTRYKYVGQYYNSVGDFDNSLKYYDSAIRSYVGNYSGSFLKYPDNIRIDPTVELLKLMRSKVSALNEAGNGQKNVSEYALSAIEYVSNSHDFLIENREELQASSEKLFLSEGFKSLYEEGIEACFRLFKISDDSSDMYFEKAFQFFNFSKSILFLEQSGELSLIQQNQISRELKSDYYRKVKELDSLESQFRVLTEKRVFGDSIRWVNSRLIVLNNDLDSMRKRIRKLIPDSEPLVRPYLEIRKVVESSPRKAYIEYFIGDENIYVLGISAKNKVFKKIKMTSEFEPLLSKLLKQLSNRPGLTNYQEELSDYQEHAFRLYELIVEPVSLELGSEIKEITIVPDETLSRLPFESLVTSISDEASDYRGLNYLIKKFDINYALSSSRIKSNVSEKKARKSLIGIGYSGQGKSSELRSSFGELPGTEEEIRYLKETVAGDYFFGDEGDKTHFLENAKEYDVLHLAVHGEADSTNRFQSSLIFNGDRGELKTNDLYIADIKARLAILSACESGIGEINKGEGTFSIARGFALVGVPSLVMSLWKVNDKVASDLMVSLHQNMSKGIKVNLALSKSKRDYLLASDKYTSHPYYWSAFVSLGEEVQLSNDEYPARTVLTLILVCSLCGFLVILIVRKKVGKRKGVN